MPIVKKTRDTAVKINRIGIMNLTHFENGIWATASAPIKTPEVGVIKFVRPTPN